MKHRIGFIGLGKMGNPMVEHLLEMGIEVVVYNRTREKTDEIAKLGAIPSYSLEEFVDKSRGEDGKAVIWLMVKAGAPVDELLFGEGDAGQKKYEEYLKRYIQEGDVIIDGGNAYYKDSIRRYTAFKPTRIDYLDCGTSGGVSGARHGACLMIGGDRDVFEKVQWVFEAVAQKDGFGYMGLIGSGHFVKMVHNAIEYGMMQSIAEGLDLLENGAEEPLGAKLNLQDILKVWNNGSIVESYLTKVTEQALIKDQHLEKITDYVEDNGEGSWTILEAMQAKIPFLTVCHALFMRYTTRTTESFAMKVIAAQRNEFGGHEVKTK